MTAAPFYTIAIQLYYRCPLCQRTMRLIGRYITRKSYTLISSRLMSVKLTLRGRAVLALGSLVVLMLMAGLSQNSEALFTLMEEQRQELSENLESAFSPLVESLDL